MAIDKKPAKYPDLGTLGSPEELDAYGVWIKSEPQDMAGGLGAMPFNTGFESRYGTGLEDMEVPDLADIDMEAQDIEIEDFKIGNFDDETAGDTEAADQGIGGEMSTHLLMRIANELSSIRSELTTLKMDFAGIRTDGLAGADEGLSGEDAITEEKAPSEDEDFAFDSLREEDAQALRKLSEENEAAMAGSEPPPAAETEELKIDFDNLEISLNEEPVLETVEPELAGEPATADPLDEIGELRDLRLEGASPMTPAPDNPDYLEGDPFAIDEFEDLPSNSLDSPMDLNLDDASLSLSLDDFADDSPLELEDTFDSESDFASLDLSDAVIDEPDLSAAISDPPLQEPVLSDISPELNGIEEVIPEGFETLGTKESVPFDDELEEALVEEELAVEDDGASAPDANAIINESPGKKTADPNINVPERMRGELKDVLSYMDHLLESLPEDKIKEFAQSEHFGTYKKIFKDLGLV